MRIRFIHDLNLICSIHRILSGVVTTAHRVDQTKVQNRSACCRVVIPFQIGICVQHIGGCSDIIPNLA